MKTITYISDSKAYSLSGIDDLVRYFPMTAGDGKLYHKSMTDKLYYRQTDDDLTFFTDIKQYSRATGEKPKIDPERAFFYRNVGFVVPPYTIFEDIYIVPPYSSIRLADGKLVTEPYFPPTGSAAVDISEFERRLSDAIGDVSGRKTCILHGGGADSSLLMALCRDKSVEARSLTCVMTGMESEADLARAISKHFGYQSDIHTCNPDRLNEIVEEYIENHGEPVCDPAMPVLTEMLENTGYDTIVDGQGADSLLLSLPHGKLINMYNKGLSVLFKPAYWILKPFDFSKTTPLGRKIYRLKKVLWSLSQSSMEDCLMISLNFPPVKQSDYYRFVKNELKTISSNLDNKFRALAYFFMFRIFPGREMQKYENLKAMGIRCVMPFLDDDLIEYIFRCDTEDLFDGKNVKKPVFELVNRKLPGFIRRNNTHPFYVDYSGAVSDSRNTFRGKKYPVADKSNFDFTSYNLDQLTRIYEQ